MKTQLDEQQGAFLHERHSVQVGMGDDRDPSTGRPLCIPEGLSPCLPWVFAAVKAMRAMVLSLDVPPDPPAAMGAGSQDL